MRRKLTAVAGVLVLSLSLSAIVAQAGAHGFGRGWHHGSFGQGAVLTGTVTSLGTGSFDANAYVLTPGAGGSSASATTTPVTITEGTETKVVSVGQSGVTVGDTFYATYAGQPSTTPIATLVAGTPSKIFAFVAPTPEVEVSGVITAVNPTSDQFTATASLVQGNGGGSPWTPQSGRGFGRHSHAKVAHGTRSHCERGSSNGTPNTIITTDSATTFNVGGTGGSTINALAVGQRFTATFDGTPSESLADVISNPANSVTAETAQTPSSLYAFVGTVTATDTSSSPETVTATVTESTPSGLFTGTDTFDVGSSTFVFGGGGSLGSLSSVSVGDVVAGGLFSTPGQTAGAIEADPLQVLIDFPASSSSSSSAAVLHHAQRVELRKAMRLLRKERIGVGGKHQHRVRFGAASHKKQ
jgi:hypothetical protein